MEIIPVARDCFGGRDACGFVRTSSRYPVALPSLSDGILIIAQGCADLIEWSPRHGCARRLVRGDEQSGIRTGRREGRFLTLVAFDGSIFEAEGR